MGGDLALLAEPADLFAEVPELLLLRATQALAAPAFVAVGLLEPGVDGLLGGLELAGELGYGPAAAGQFDDLLAELGWIRGTMSGHGGLGLVVKCTTIHQTGSTPAQKSPPPR